MFNNKKVLITGGLGFIGSNLAIQFVKQGASVTIYDCLDSHSGGNLYNIMSIRDQISLQLQNILDFGTLSQQVMGQDIIINCAASTSHQFSMREPWVDLDMNSKGVINLLEAIRRFNPEVRLIHLGTSTQLGPLIYQPADEKHPEYPTDIYSANKSASEKYVLIYTRSYKTRATVVRLANVYGQGAAIHSSEFTFNNYFVGLALQNKVVSIFGSGQQKRNICHISDIVNAIIKLVGEERAVGQALFVVGDHHVSVNDIAQKITNVMGGSVQNIDWPIDRERIEIGDVMITNNKLKQLIDWKPVIDFDTGIKDMYAYYKSCLEYYLK